MGHKQLTHKENEVTFNFDAVQGQIAGPLDFGPSSNFASNVNVQYVI